jgi:hypothetical protein
MEKELVLALEWISRGEGEITRLASNQSHFELALAAGNPGW